MRERMNESGAEKLGRNLAEVQVKNDGELWS